MMYIDEPTPFELSRMKKREKLKSLKRRESREQHDGQVLCTYCHHDLSHIRIHLSHIVPESMGGETEESNIVLACQHCINSKSNMTLEAWHAQLERQMRGVTSLLAPASSEVDAMSMAQNFSASSDTI